MTSAMAAAPLAVPQFPQSQVRLLPGEVVLKTWQVSRPRSGAGYLHLTDTRLVFTGRTVRALGSTVVLQEVHIRDVNGITAYVDRGIGLLAVLVTGTLGLLAASNTLVALIDPGGLPLAIFWLPALFWIAAFAGGLWYTLTRGSLGLLVHSRTSQHTPIALGRPSVFGLSRLQRSINRLYTRPTRDVDAIIAEIGARILDIQAHGSDRMANPVGPWGTP
jgi:hypothetical protein